MPFRVGLDSAECRVRMSLMKLRGHGLQISRLGERSLCSLLASFLRGGSSGAISLGGALSGRFAGGLLGGLLFLNVG